LGRMRWSEANGRDTLVPDGRGGMVPHQPISAKSAPAEVRSNS